MRVANQFNYFQTQNNNPKPPSSQYGSDYLKKKGELQITNKFTVPNILWQNFLNDASTTAGSLQNGQITEFYFHKLIHIEYQLCLVVFLNMVLIIISSSISFPELKSHENTTYKGCLYFTVVCFIIQCFLLGFRMSTVLELQKQQKILYEKSTIFSSKKVFYFFAECLIMMIQPYPFLQDINIVTLNSYEMTQFNLPVNDLLTAISVLRVYVFIRAGLILTPYRNTRSHRLCKMYGCKADFSFSLKCMFKNNPLILIGVFFTISSMIFAFQIYLIQRRAAYLESQSIGMSNNYMNALWLVLMTITTVGYGDYFPHTSIGRIIILIVAIWGTFIVSMMVVVISNTLNMQKNEKRTTIIINKLQLRGQIQKQAQLLVGYFILMKKFQKQSRNLQTKIKSTENMQEIKWLQDKKKQTDRALQRFGYLCGRKEKSFSKVRKQIKNGQDIEDIEDEVSSHFLHVNSDIQILNKNQQKIIGFIHEYLQYNGKNIEKTKENKEEQQDPNDDEQEEFEQNEGRQVQIASNQHKIRVETDCQFIQEQKQED